MALQRSRLAYVTPNTAIRAPVMILDETAGLFGPISDGMSAAVIAHCPTEITISCQGISIVKLVERGFKDAFSLFHLIDADKVRFFHM